MLAAVPGKRRLTDMRLLRLLGLLAFGQVTLPPGGSASGAGQDYADLLRLFEEWRAFQKPRFVDHVPDYTAAAMARQKRRLPEFQRRLAAIDPGAWSVGQQVDWHLVRAEMNGLDFDHRVLRPWSRNPCFYTVVHTSEHDTPLREGASLPGTIELWSYKFPLAAADLADLKARLQAIPVLLGQARANLVEDARDLWRLGARVKRGESAALADFARRVEPHHPELAAPIAAARSAVDAFGDWLEQKQETMTAPSGVGIENYDWYLRNVHLVPFTWKEERALMERELGRAVAQLKLEENRNRALPSLEPDADAARHRRRFEDAVTEYVAFLRDKQIFTVKDYVDPALRARGGSFTPPGDRDIFDEVDLRDPLPMRCHGSHWIDHARLLREPHASAIRRARLLYNIWDGRSEGLATAMEEMMMSAGLYEGKPRSRELVYVLVANRAARGLAGMRVHSKEFDVDQARRFAHERTPYGWLRQDGELNWAEQQLYLTQPGYGTCYLTGKLQIEALLADRSRQQGDKFTLRSFMDEFFASDMIPVSLIRWELTGDGEEVQRLAAP
jgi:hypothetical protein